MEPFQEEKLAWPLMATFDRSFDDLQGNTGDLEGPRGSKGVKGDIY